ncbi:MAG: transporter substrate-binding domain-containing protein [Ramlibacter sp.]
MTFRKLLPHPRWPLMGALLLALNAAAQSPAAPAAGVSARADAIRKAGVLRVGVLGNPPWLAERPPGQSPNWYGPAWMVSEEYARLLGVKLQAVPVSHETKVPALALNQVDIAITPLTETPERLKIIDYIILSSTSICMFGLQSNPKFANAKTVDDFNNPDVTIAYFTGGGEEAWIRKRFANAKLRGVSSSGGAAPVEEITGRRADVVPINRVPWVVLNNKVKGLGVLPKENNCQDSKEFANPIGIAIDKNQAPLLEWMRAVQKAIAPQLKAEEQRVVDAMIATSK